MKCKAKVNEELSLLKQTVEKNFYRFEVMFNFRLPLVSELISVKLFYEELDPPNIVISSPVPSRENWRYWQNINIVSIENVDNNNFKKNRFSLPTPFSFYTGDHGKIVNHVKTWINE